MNAAGIAHALGGKDLGQGRFLVPCIVSSHGKGRGDINPSLQLCDGDNRLLVHCFGGCDPRDILDELRRRGLRGDTPFRPIPNRTAANREPPGEPDPDPSALAFWGDCEPIDGTLAETYLREVRGIENPRSPSLRFHNCARYPRTGTTFPALVAAVAGPDKKIRAIQITFLRLDRRKAPLSCPRLTFGHMGSGAIRLAPTDGPVLGLAEGTETAMSAAQLADVPCWSTVGGQRLGRITLPDGIREVHIFADSDDAGKLMAERAAGIYTRAGRKVLLRWPPEGFGDWNDYLFALRAGKVAA